MNKAKRVDSLSYIPTHNSRETIAVTFRTVFFLLPRVGGITVTNPLNFVAVILKVLLVNLLTALNFANVFLKKLKNGK